MLCRKCGVDVPHVCEPQALVGRAVTACTIAKGAIWVQVTGQGAGIEGVQVRAAGVTKETDPTGFAGFETLDEGDYEAEVLGLPGAVEESFGLPLTATSPAPVQSGEITFLAFALAPRIKPRLTLSATAVAVRGPRITAELVAEPAFEGQGTGTLSVSAGAASIKLYQQGGPEVVLNANAVTFDSVPGAGITLEIEAVDHSALDGVQFEWSVASETLPVAADPATATATAAKAELVVETSQGTTLSDEVKHGDGGIVHLQDPANTRARLKVTPRCQPADFVGQLQLTAIKDNFTVYDQEAGGGVVDLATPIDVGPGIVVPPYYLEGTTVSDSATDSGLTLAMVNVVDQADEVKLTVVETKLVVYGGTPGPSDPAVALTDDAKVDPGRRLYVQNTDKWWWGRAKLRVTKNPPLAPCRLAIREAGAGAIRLFAEEGQDPQAQMVSLENHVEGEAAIGLPIELAADAITDAQAGIVYWTEGVTSTGTDSHELLLDIIDVEQACDRAVFRVLPPLDEYDRISVIDLGGPGSGHQAAVVKLFEGLAAIGFAGDVVLSYNRKKTKIYASKFGRGADLNHPVNSYGLYHNEWAGTYPAGAAGPHQLNIRCQPIGQLDIQLTAAQTRVFTDLQTFWTQYAWPGANPPEFTDPSPGGFGRAAANWREQAKWTRSNNTDHVLPDGNTITKLQYEQQQWRQSMVYNQQTGAAMAPYADLVELAPVVDRTLTAFGAMDMHAADEAEAAAADFQSGYFDRHWLPVLRRMTREAHPAAMSFQPFLWTAGHPMQVRQDTIIDPPVNVADKVVAAGGKAVYRLEPGDPAGDDGIIAGLPTVASTLLRKAKAGDATLISAYYGAPVSDIQYDHLLRVMVRVVLAANLPGKVMVALIGDDMKLVETTVAAETVDGTVVARTDGADSDPAVKVELAHVGRTNAMTLFQRYSTMFITEGANTWQEVLLLGTPTLSVKPTGNTKPWEENPPAAAGGDTVRDASTALVAAQDPGDGGAQATVLAFLNAALDPGSEVCQYFAAWRDLLSDPRSDQVMTAVKYLPDPADL